MRQRETRSAPTQKSAGAEPDQTDPPAPLTRAELGLEPGRGEMLNEGRVDDEFDTLAVGGAIHALKLELDNGADLIAAERMEDDDLVDAVDELRPDVDTQDTHQLVLEITLVLRSTAAKPQLALNDAGAEIRCRDHHSVGEVNHPVLPIGEPPIAENL